MHRQAGELALGFLQVYLEGDLIAALRKGSFSSIGIPIFGKRFVAKQVFAGVQSLDNLVVGVRIVHIDAGRQALQHSLADGEVLLLLKQSGKIDIQAQDVLVNFIEGSGKPSIRFDTGIKLARTGALR